MSQIGLKDALEALRVELSEAILVSEGKQIRFEVGEVEMEFQVTLERSAGAKSGVKFWVVDGSAEVAEKRSTVHKIKIPLKPVWQDGRPVLTGSEEERE
jgi:hypothetical protein